MEEEKGQKTNWFLILIGLSCLAVIAVTFYSFYFQKNYDFFVETACDPTIEECFERDCTNPADCPPNGYSHFKRYTLNASDFSQCENEDCKNACETGAIECEQSACEENEEWGETCVSPETLAEIEESLLEETPTENEAEEVITE